MSLVTLVWLMIAAAAATVAIIHAVVAVRLRDARGHGAFSVCAASLAGIAVVEWLILRAQTPQQFGQLLWLLHFPLWTGLVGSVLYLHLHLRAGRAWLCWAAVAARTAVMLVNAFSEPNLNYRQITALEPLLLFGEPVAAARGVPNPWMGLGTLSGLLLVLFAVDAALAVWRRRGRPAPVTYITLGALLVLAAIMNIVRSVWGDVPAPMTISLFLAPVVALMGAEATSGLLTAAAEKSLLQRRRLELEEAEARLALSAEAAKVGLWSVDMRTGRIWATPVARAMFGLGRGEHYTFDDAAQAIHPDDRERVRSALGSMQQDGRATVEYRLQTPGGALRHCVSMGGLHQDPGTGERVLTGVTLDITERRRIEQAAAVQRLEFDHLERRSQLTEFSSAMAHELSQPLAIAMSNAEAAQGLLARPGTPPGELRAILRDVAQAGERAQQVLVRLRALLGLGQPRREVLAINDLASQALASMDALLQARGIQVERRLSPQAPQVVGDRVPLEQVIFNLLTNAWQAMAHTPAGRAVLRVETSVSGDEVRLVVGDRGHGLPDPPERVFERFFSTKSEGLGMGLAICRSIVQAHAGRIHVEPAPEGGARFIVVLPRAPAAGADPGAAA